MQYEEGSQCRINARPLLVVLQKPYRKGQRLFFLYNRFGDCEAAWRILHRITKSLPGLRELGHPFSDRRLKDLQQQHSKIACTNCYAGKCFIYQFYVLCVVQCGSAASPAVNNLFVYLYVRSFALALSRSSCKQNGSQMGKAHFWETFLSECLFLHCHCCRAVVCTVSHSHVPEAAGSDAHCPHGLRLWIGQGALCWGCQWMLDVMMCLSARHHS